MNKKVSSKVLLHISSKAVTQMSEQEKARLTGRMVAKIKDEEEKLIIRRAAQEQQLARKIQKRTCLQAVQDAESILEAACDSSDVDSIREAWDNSRKAWDQLQKAVRKKKQDRALKKRAKDLLGL